ncbi:agouti-related protein isoform X3 [Esox lucius]|nr:agouti-related protein isoform X3 [Esox lucius]
MVNPVVLFWWSLTLFQLTTGLVHGNARADVSHPSLRRTEDSFLLDIGKDSLSRGDPASFDSGSEEEQLMMDTGSYDEDAAEAVLLQSRAQRPPRRCVPHQQSCLGHPLPCCDPCDTCYCRFFNAFCYCRRVGQSCAGGHGRP